jgi:hypothetical protein
MLCNVSERSNLREIKLVFLFRYSFSSSSRIITSVDMGKKPTANKEWRLLGYYAMWLL